MQVRCDKNFGKRQIWPHGEFLKLHGFHQIKSMLKIAFIEPVLNFEVYSYTLKLVITMFYDG